MHSPQFSIITVTLNNLFGLRRTYDSIQTQTCDDYEWIVIDGNSSDGTQDFLKQKHACYISEPDNGIYDAMNKGIERANGRYLIFMNAGDYFSDEQILEFINQKIIELKPDFIYGDALESVDGALHYKKSRPHTKINQGMFTHHQAMVYSHNLLKEQRYNTEYVISADYDLTLSALKESGEILHIPLPFCVYKSGGISQQQVLTGRKEQFAIRKNHGISRFKNALIFVIQTLLYRLRRIFPKLYWWLKRH